MDEPAYVTPLHVPLPPTATATTRIMLDATPTVWLQVSEDADATLLLLTASLTGNKGVEGDVESHTSPFIPAMALISAPPSEKQKKPESGGSQARCVDLLLQYISFGLFPQTTHGWLRFGCVNGFSDTPKLAKMFDES